MTHAAESLKSELLNLSVPDRAELAHFLIRSLDDGCDPDTEAAWDLELSRRVQEIENGLETGESAESVFAQLREKYSS